ncbi:hypothetical protein WJX73_003267 [Symbiochloris irregularis]|uniref:Uncharacterized protein n=1 Tax=Symbiochloris irregularis TaxID=706552 RepID=A0AAW1PRC0_9CHLO
MASLFPINRPSEAVDGTDVKLLEDQGFTSFDPTAFAAFKAQQRREGEGPSLADAAQHFASSSEDEADEPPDNIRVRGLAGSAQETDSDSGQQPHKNARKRARDSKKHKHHKHKRKRRKTDAEKIAELERRAAEDERFHQQPHLTPAVTSGSKDAEADEPLLDKRGDMANLQFESLYQPPARRTWDPQYLKAAAREAPTIASIRGIGAETDGDRQFGLNALRRRFFLKGAQSREKNPALKRLCMWRLKRHTEPTQESQKPKMALPTPTFVPLELEADPMDDDDTREGGECIAESAEEAAARRKRAAFAGTRDRPHELQNWLDDAGLIDGKLPDGAVSRGAAERIIEVLNQALVHHPGSEALLVPMLAAERVLLVDLDNNIGRLQSLWEMVLEKHSGSVKLWQILCAMIGRYCRTFILAGFHEKAVGVVQSLLEFHFFTPPLAGQEGAQGWSAWMTGGLASQQPEAEEEAAEPEPSPAPQEMGGWFTVSEPGGHQDDDPKDIVPAFLHEVLNDSDEEGQEVAEVEADEGGTDEEQLYQEAIARIKAREGQPWEADLANTWAAQERNADSAACLPAERKADADEALQEGDENYDIQRDASAWPEVHPCLFALSSKQMREHLAYTLLDLLDAPLGQWLCSNDPTAMHAAQSSSTLPASDAHALKQAFTHSSAPEGSAPPASTSWLHMRHPEDSNEDSASQIWYQADEQRRLFLSRLLQSLVEGPLSDNPHLCSAFLQVEGASAAGALSEGEAETADEALTHSKGVERARAAAKGVLAKRRESLALWGAYAALEASAGQRKAARKVFDTALASLATRPASVGRHAALLALPFAQMEADSSAKDAGARALHILAWLGVGGAYQSYTKVDTASSAFRDRLLQARRGFQAMVTAHMTAHSLSATGAAVVAAAAHFEKLAGNLPGAQGGLIAAVTLLQQVLSSASPEVLKISVEHESLQLCLCRMVAQAVARNEASPRHLHSTLQTAVKVYPCNAELWGMLMQAEAAACSFARLRRTLTAARRGNPASLALVLALALCEGFVNVSAASSHSPEAVLKTASQRGSPLQHSPVLQRAYMWCLASRGMRVKAVEVAAMLSMTACPWAKVLLVDMLALDTAEAKRKTVRARECITAAFQRGLLLRTDPAEVEVMAQFEDVPISL